MLQYYWAILEKSGGFNGCKVEHPICYHCTILEFYYAQGCQLLFSIV